MRVDMAFDGFKFQFSYQCLEFEGIEFLPPGFLNIMEEIINKRPRYDIQSVFYGNQQETGKGQFQFFVFCNRINPADNRNPDNGIQKTYDDDSQCKSRKCLFNR